MSGEQIAKTILAQLGGNRFTVMTGAKNFVHGDRYLMMQLPSNKSRATHLRITLELNDTYTMSFMKMNRRTYEVTPITEVTMIYADKLAARFTEVTGFDTHL